MNINLSAFQTNAIKKINDAMESDKDIILESGTGSGKTIILTHFLYNFMKMKSNYVTVWFCPGKGDLEEQSKKKMDSYIPNASTKLLDDVLNTGFTEGDTAFINWECVTKKGNRALSDGEEQNLIDKINIAHDRGLKFIIIIDEEHLNKTIKSYDVVTMFNAEKIIRASATPQKDKNAIHIEVPDEEVVKAGLVKKMIFINEDIEDNIELSNQVEYLLDLGIKKQSQIKEEFVKNNVAINPLIIIQIPNKSESLVESVENYLEKRGINYNNKELAIWLADRKENLENIEENKSSVKAIIIKQAIATGWDCPRAYVLIKLRENMSETFEIQTIGRIRRMPEAKHYENQILDNCYLYTFDEKYKEGVMEHFGDRVLNATTLYLRKEYENVNLVKEKAPEIMYENSPLNAMAAFQEYLKQEYCAIKMKFTENIKSFKSYHYSFEKIISVDAYKGEVSTLNKNQISKLNKVKIKIQIDTHEYGRIFHQTIAKLGRGIGISYENMSIIIRRLFCETPQFDGKILNLNNKELYAFVINNSELLERDLKRSMSNEKYSKSQLAFNENIEEKFMIPKKLIFTYDAAIKDFDIYNKNVYKGYISIAKPRSQGEKIFERFCEEYDKVDWFYKNGDKGSEYFSIVYEDNSCKKRNFYPDYILSIQSKIWIVEVKGGESDDGKSEDIDAYSEKKMKALMNYVQKHNILGGFIRYNKSDMRLYINVDSYTESLQNDNWKRLDRFF